jgi:O-antigen ligase
MRFMLAALIALVVTQDIFDLPLSLAPGLSAKNALLYALAAALAFKTAVQGFRLELRAVHVCFAVLIGYAAVSLLAARWVIDYPRYDVVGSAINLKSGLVDQAIFFLVFFYGLRETANAAATLRVLLLAVVVGNTTGVLDAWGIVQIGELDARTDGRMNGVMGEANQYAAFVSLFLPALVAAVIASRGPWRVIWLAGLLISAAGMIMAVSRGAFVALLVGSIWGAFLLRRHLSGGKVVAFTSAALGVVTILLVLLAARYGDLLVQRVLAESQGDLGGVSSGRTEIWAAAIARMAQTPLTLLTGFGWNVYWAMPFRYSPHNHYVALWFNLGLPGLACGTLLLIQAVRTARLAVDKATQQRPMLMAFVVGVLAFSVAAFFVDLYVPWLWFWAYAGLMLRIAINASTGAPRFAGVQQEAVSVKSPADLYGWTAPARSAR